MVDVIWLIVTGASDIIDVVLIRYCMMDDIMRQKFLQTVIVG